MNYEQKLLSSIEKRFKTTMIGSLARFEEAFGYLWEEPSDKQDMFDRLWEDTRNNVLNNGNNQLRAAIDELADYLYHNNNQQPKRKYHYKFFFNNNHHNGGHQE
jgi:hypothetical protein